MNRLNIGAHNAARNAPEVVDGIVNAERAGLDTAWVTVGGIAPDPFAVFAVAATRTERITFGTSIVPTFPRHPLAMAQGAMTVDQFAPGRFRLGVGPSHKPGVESMWGIPFERPLTHLREYLTILNAILGEGRVSFEGEILHAEAALAGPTQVQVLASALRPRAFRLCGELTQGAISWMCPPPISTTLRRPPCKRAHASPAARSPR